MRLTIILRTDSLGTGSSNIQSKSCNRLNSFTGSIELMYQNASYRLQFRLQFLQPDRTGGGGFPNRSPPFFSVGLHHVTGFNASLILHCVHYSRLSLRCRIPSKLTIRYRLFATVAIVSFSSSQRSPPDRGNSATELSAKKGKGKSNLLHGPRKHAQQNVNRH
jgi:hypothetical protein